MVDPLGLSVRGGGLSPHPADRCTQPHADVVVVAAWTPGGWRGRASARIQHLPNRGLIAPASIAVHLVKDVFSQARGPSRQVLFQRLMGVHSPNSSAPPPCTCMLVTAILLTAQRSPRDVDYEAGARLPMAARA